MVNPKILDNVRLLQKCILVDKEGLILALRRAPDDHSRGGNWDLPGGGYEQGELVIDAIKREVMEEAGLVIDAPQPIFFTNQLDVAKGFFQGHNVFGMCYVSHKWSGEVVLSSEHIEFKWMTPEYFLTLDFGDDGGFFKASTQSYLQTVR